MKSAWILGVGYPNLVSGRKSISVQSLITNINTRSISVCSVYRHLASKFVAQQKHEMHVSQLQTTSEIHHKYEARLTT